MSTNHWHDHHSAMREKILAFIVEFTRVNGYSPSYREIGAATNIRSTSTIGKYVQVLIADGTLSSDHSKSRTLALTTTEDARETVRQRLCLKVADGGKLYMDCVLEKPRSSLVRVSFEGVLDAKAMRGPVSEIVGVYPSYD